MPKKKGEGELGQFADLREGLARKRRRVDTPIHTVLLLLIWGISFCFLGGNCRNSLLVELMIFLF